MKKRIASLLLALSMTACLLSGCGTVDVDATNDEVKTSQETEDNSSTVSMDDTTGDEKQTLYSITPTN